MSTAIDEGVGGPQYMTLRNSFSTLVLRAGRTSLPSLRVQDFSTPLTQKAFTAGLFDATTTSNLGSSKPKCVWKSGQPAQNNMEVISTQKRNGISICPRLGMSCSLVQHKLSPSHASHVVSKLRQVTCATRMDSHS